MTSHDFWMNVLVHFVAIVLGGLKLAIFSGIFWYVFRKKYMAKFMGKLMQDLMSQLNPAPDPAAHARVAEPFVPGTQFPAFAEPVPGYPLMNDHVPLPIEVLQPMLDEMRQLDPKTQAEALAIVGKHGFVYDTFGRLIRKPVA